MVEFYRDVLGLRVIRESDSSAEIMNRHLGIPGTQRMLVFVGTEPTHHQLELVHYVQPTSPEGHLTINALGAAHICFNVTGLESYYEDLVSKGVRFVTPPVIREGQTSDLVICYAQDPEGNWLEFIENRPHGNA
jgi:catechol 2,3-dioxygenase-like lactoylglutathione lyase family enzyme